MAVPKATDWNVVVVGSWNRAILTPGCVKEHLLQLPKNSVVEVQVPVDVPAPPRVKHGGITVTVLGAQLVIDADPPTYEGIESACQAAARAIRYLDKTPVTAAGINIRYQFDELPENLVTACRQKLDEEISDFGRTIKQRTTQRSIAFRSGLLNLSVAQAEDATGLVLLNFHRNSEVGADLIEWLEAVEDIKREASSVVEGLLRITLSGE